MSVAALRRLANDRRGSVAIIFALALIPLIFLTGMAIDYTSAARKKSQLDAAADAAALAAVTPPMMAQPDAASITAAQNVFNARAMNIPGLNYGTPDLIVDVVDVGLTRTVTVSYTASSQNAFPNVLKQTAWPIKGSSTSTATVAPNIDFYLLLDSSPSMAIAATTAGINTMVSHTSAQGGCAFACHESYPKGENPALGNPNNEDNYALAKSLGVTLRIDNLRTATQDLMTTAQQTENANNNIYRMAIYTFDVNFNTIATLTSSLSAAATAASNITMLEVHTNNWLTSTNNNQDADTNYDNAMNSINTIMPNPGGGTNNKGDTPQEVLFFVTDGVEDEMVSGKRQESLMDNGWCTTIKNRGIRIAVLYTTYLPLPTNSWYKNHIASFQPNIGTTLQSCASPGLFFQVSTDQDISAAMKALFLTAVQTARLSQ